MEGACHGHGLAGSSVLKIRMRNTRVPLEEIERWQISQRTIIYHRLCDFSKLLRFIVCCFYNYKMERKP